MNTKTLNKKEALEFGFIISNRCVACNGCKRNCPNDAIIKGDPYKIDQNKCVRCGTCYIKCPSEAIELNTNRL
ncbi:MAG: 4Fe-4S binding protein [Anaerovoracaceae bacterium]